MSQSTLGSRRGFLSSITDFNLGQLSVSADIKAAVLITVLLIIGVLSNHLIESVVATLGTIISIGKLVRKSDGPEEVEKILSTMIKYGETHILRRY